MRAPCHDLPIAPTFRDFTDLTVAVNLNAPPANAKEPADDDTGAVTREDTPAEMNPNGETSGEPSYQDRIRQFREGIGESLTGRDEEAIGMFDLTLRSFETMQNAIAAVKLAAYRPDVVINVPRDACSAHEFHRAEELIALGYRLTEDAMGSAELQGRNESHRPRDRRHTSLRMSEDGQIV